MKEIENHCILGLNNLLISIGENPLNHYGLSTRTINNYSINNREYLEEMNYDQSLLTFLLETSIIKKIYIYIYIFLLCICLWLNSS